MKLEANDLYYLDADAGDRVINFVEGYCCHYEDRWAEQPFLLLDYQKQLIKDLFGWKRHADNLRRFRELYLEISKGNGKSPLLAALGLYLLLADGEPGALIISAATDFQQANVTFDCAKKMIRNSPRLQKMEEDGKIIVLDRAIKVPKTNSEWRIVSGTDVGKAGTRPTCLLMDEAHEWPNRRCYDSLTRNCAKRSQPLILIATNSGNRKDTICWELHERAEKVLKGESKDDTLYPVLYCLPEDLDISTDEKWLAAVQKANPALDKIITTETLRHEWAKAQEVMALEREFRRLHLGQWVEGSDESWLDMVAVDDCSRRFAPDEVEGLTWYLGWDGSLNDDLSALVMVAMGSEKLFAKAKFWLPRQTAYEYEDKYSIKYTEWAKAGDIELIEAVTIDPQTQREISEYIIELAKQFKIKCICYDPSRASNLVALLEDAGITCVPVSQGFKLSQSLFELERRIKDKSIVLWPNHVLRYCFTNAQIKIGELGGYMLKKPGADGRYAGDKKRKIDGVSALATALHQVRLDLMNPTKPSVYETRGVLVI